MVIYKNFTHIGPPYKKHSNMKEQIKESRQRIDALLDVLKLHRHNREYVMAYDSLQLGFMRLGLLLGHIGAKYPYPESMDAESPVIEAPTDKAKSVLELPDLPKEVGFVKFIRLQIDSEIGALEIAFKEYFKEYSPGHEALIALDSLRESKMWMGQQLNNIREGEIQQANYLKESKEKDLMEAKEAYHRYGETTDFKNFQGNPMPKFEDLSETIQQAWVNAIRHPYRNDNGASVCPSPSNYAKPRYY